MARYVRQIKPPGAKEGQSRIYAMTPELEKKIQDDPKGQEFKEVYGGFEDGKFIEKKRTISLGLKMEVEKEKKEPEPEPGVGQGKPPRLEGRRQEKPRQAQGRSADTA
jgi:hypothetical protein